MAMQRILVLGYGNPGRGDDGLGPALVAALEARDLPGVTSDADYQLTVEDAARLATHDVVVFVDAAAAGPEPFSFRPVETAGGPALRPAFSSHSAQPEGVVALAEHLFGARPSAYVLGVRGYEFNEFREELSPAAVSNLSAAVDFLDATLRAGTLARRAAAEPDCAAPAQPAAKGPEP